MSKTMFELWGDVQRSDDFGKEFIFSDWCGFRAFAEAAALNPEDGIEGVRAALGAIKNPLDALDTMTVAELKKLAAEKEIDLGDAKRKADIIQLISGEAEKENECD